MNLDIGDNVRPIKQSEKRGPLYDVWSHAAVFGEYAFQVKINRRLPNQCRRKFLTVYLNALVITGPQLFVGTSIAISHDIQHLHWTLPRYRVLTTLTDLTRSEHSNQGIPSNSQVPKCLAFYTQSCRCLLASLGRDLAINVK